MSFMNFLDPGGFGSNILNVGGWNQSVLPYLSTIGGVAGGLIGGAFGVAPLGAAVGAMGGEQLSGYLGKDEAKKDPFSGEVLGSGAKKGGTAAALAYIGSSLLGAGGGGKTTSGGWESTGIGPEGVAETGVGGGGGPATLPTAGEYSGTAAEGVSPTPTYNAGPEGVVEPNVGGNQMNLTPNDYLMFQGYQAGMEPGTYPAEPSTWDKISGYGGKAYDYMSERPMLTTGLGLTALNALNSYNQASMTKGANQAQQQSWQDYLNAINPPETVKAQRYGAGLGEVERTGTQTREKVASQMAARGVRGRGTAAPTGDVAEAERQAKNLLYNQIYGQYNVPSAPGPSNYAPSGGQLFGANTTQSMNYLLPLLMMSQYGNRNQPPA